MRYYRITKQEKNKEAHKMKRKRWTFSGIKKFFPKLTFEDWLKICKSRKQYEIDLPWLLKEGNV